MQIFKFGGASVKDAPSVINSAKIIKAKANVPTVVVVSAMGKTTNNCEKIVNAFFNKDASLHAHMEAVKNYHLTILNQLISNLNHPIYSEIENVFVELSWAVDDEPTNDYHFHYDQIVSLGEILSTKIISAYLNEQGIKNRWMDARGLIQTDNNYREGNVDFKLSEELVKTQINKALTEVSIVITQGFIGGTSENFTTTLGREGSDYTASLLAYFLDAEKVIIWKDVKGVLNADPKYFKNTHKIDELTYHDAIELTYYGATVIHPKTIKPLQNKNIPLFVKSFELPDAEGTVIKDSNIRLDVTSYIFKENQILLSLQAKDFSFIAEENLSIIFSKLSKHHIKVNMMQNSALSFSICMDADEYKVPLILEEFQQLFNVLYNTDVYLMTIRNYNDEIIATLIENKVVLMEQKSRNTCQMVLRSE